ncbi:hypothetical protein [Ornithinibacillus scapharcae]|uniref:hypothetical protein n=1 Tax=Ornithinibacillus scapharcae TaxID=1147159 RepID=UPI000225BD1D|nr:hypothetical protein [Ornithinibacillus scapharcae]
MSTALEQSHQTRNMKNQKGKVLCKKCKSNQIVANKRGYSFRKMFNSLLITIIICFALAIFFPSLDNVEGPGNLNIIGFILFYIGFPVAIIRGFIGRSDIVNGCMNCGNKWIAGGK